MNVSSKFEHVLYIHSSDCDFLDELMYLNVWF